jgi:ketosteroid isomerase-like protein
MSDVLQRFSVTETQSPTKTEVDSTLAYQWGDFTVTLVAKSGGEAVVRSGKYLRIYRRCADGSWIMIVDSFSANQPDSGWGEILLGNKVEPVG